MLINDCLHLSVQPCGHACIDHLGSADSSKRFVSYFLFVCVMPRAIDISDNQFSSVDPDGVSQLIAITYDRHGATHVWHCVMDTSLLLAPNTSYTGH